MCSSTLYASVFSSTRLATSDPEDGKQSVFCIQHMIYIVKRGLRAVRAEDQALYLPRVFVVYNVCSNGAALTQAADLPSVIGIGSLCVALFRVVRSPSLHPTRGRFLLSTGSASRSMGAAEITSCVSDSRVSLWACRQALQGGSPKNG